MLLFDWHALKPLLRFGGWILVASVVAMAGNFGLHIVISRQMGSEGLGLYFLAAALATGSILWFADQRFSLGLLQNLLIVFPQAANILKLPGIGQK